MHTHTTKELLEKHVAMDSIAHRQVCHLHSLIVSKYIEVRVVEGVNNISKSKCTSLLLGNRPRYKLISKQRGV